MRGGAESQERAYCSARGQGDCHALKR